MSVFQSKLTRRAMMRAAAIAAIPVLAPLPAFASAFATPASASPIAALWARAVALKQQMAPYAAQIDAAFANGGTPGWMRLNDRANALGHARYEALIAILKATPKTLDDLAIVARATGDEDIRNGPRSWAHHQFDRASREYHLAA